MKANTRFSITTASTHVDNMQTSTENENQESFDLKKSIQQHIGETYQYAPIPMERLHPSPSSVHLDADGIVGKAHEILPASTFDLSGLSKRCDLYDIFRFNTKY